MVRSFAVAAIALSAVWPLGAQFNLNLPIRAIAVDGTIASNVWIATDGGLFRSDTGTLWRNTYLRPAGQVQPAIRQILMQGANGQIIYLATDTDDGGVWKTVDGGATWAIVNKGLPPSGAPVDILIPLPNAPLTLYAKIGAEVYKTVDGGANWTLRGRMPANGSSFTVAPSNPQMMYAALDNAIYRSRDEGVTWTLSQALDMAGGTFVSSMLVDPSDSNYIYLSARGPAQARGRGLYRSTDAGERFVLYTDPRGFGIFPVQLFADPTGKVIYSSTDEGGGIYRTTNKGATWGGLATPRNFGPIILAFDPNNPKILWAGTLVGTFSNNNGGEANWSARIAEGKPTILAPRGPIEFFLPTDTQGRVDFSIRVIETSAWSVTFSLDKVGGSWLDLGNRPVNTPANPQITVNTRGLEPGIYDGAIRINAPQAGNAVTDVPVKLTVLPPRAGADPYMISTVAGSGLPGRFGDNGLAIRASLGETDSVAVDREGNIYFAESNNHVVRRITTDGVVRRYAGNGQAGTGGDGGEALLANLNAPRGLAVDAAGNLYIADTASRRIRKVTPDGRISTLVNDIGGPVRSLAVDSTGTLYVAAPAGHVILRVTAAGAVSFYAGAPGQPGYRGDGGHARDSRLAGPEDVAVDKDGNLYIADTGNHRIRKIEKDGRITTVAGSGSPGYQGEGDSALARSLFSPKAIAVDAAGNLIIADFDNQRVRLVTPRGVIRTIAGTGVGGFAGDNGPGPVALIRGPDDVAVDAAGNVIQLESGNYRIRKLTAPPPPVVPEISEGALVNLVDGSPRLAPGVLFRLTGAKLSAESATRDGAPWPDELAGTRVTIGGRTALLNRVSPEEITGQIPFEVQPGSAGVIVTRGETNSIEVPVTIAQAAPALLLRELGRAAATNEDGTENSPGIPAAAGSVVTAYFTGQGATENQPASGAAAGGDAGTAPVLPVSAIVGDVEVEVVSVWLMPGAVGVSELKFRAPGGAPGDYPLRVRVGSETSGDAIVSLAGSPQE